MDGLDAEMVVGDGSDRAAREQSDPDEGSMELGFDQQEQEEDLAGSAEDGSVGDESVTDSDKLKAELVEFIRQLGSPRRVDGAAGADLDLDLPPASAETVQQLLAYLKANTPSPLSAEVQAQGIKFRADTVAYRAAPENWETVLERPDDFCTRLHDVAAEPERREGSLDKLREQVMNNRQLRRIYQFPGGQTILIDYLIKILECAAGGFFLLTAAAGRIGFWDAFFPAVMPFFLAGGQGVIILPLSEIDRGAFQQLLAWKHYIDSELGQATATSGLRFVFMTSFDNATLHAKELYVVCPGGRVVHANMTANMNTAALGIKALNLPPGEDRATADKSIETLVIQSVPHDSPEGRESVDDIACVYAHFGEQGWYIYAVPALVELATLRATETPADLENKARRRVNFQALRIAGLDSATTERKARTDWLVGISSVRSGARQRAGQGKGEADEHAAGDDAASGSAAGKDAVGEGAVGKEAAGEDAKGEQDARKRVLGLAAPTWHIETSFDAEQQARRGHKSALRKLRPARGDKASRERARAAREAAELRQIDLLSREQPALKEALTSMRESILAGPPKKRKRQREKRKITTPLSDSSDEEIDELDDDEVDELDDSSDEDGGNEDGSGDTGNVASSSGRGVNGTSASRGSVASEAASHDTDGAPRRKLGALKIKKLSAPRIKKLSASQEGSASPLQGAGDSKPLFSKISSSSAPTEQKSLGSEATYQGPAGVKRKQDAVGRPKRGPGANRQAGDVCAFCGAKRENTREGSMRIVEQFGETACCPCADRLKSTTTPILTMEDAKKCVASRRNFRQGVPHEDKICTICGRCQTDYKTKAGVYKVEINGDKRFLCKPCRRLNETRLPAATWHDFYAWWAVNGDEEKLRRGQHSGSLEQDHLPPAAALAASDRSRTETIPDSRLGSTNGDDGDLSMRDEPTPTPAAPAPRRGNW